MRSAVLKSLLITPVIHITAFWIQCQYPGYWKQLLKKKKKEGVGNEHWN